MAQVCNLSPLHRPPTPSLDRGPVQRRVRRAFIATGKPVLSTSQIVEWSHPSQRGAWHVVLAARGAAIIDESGDAVGWRATGSASWPQQLDLAIAG